MHRVDPLISWTYSSKRPTKQKRNKYVIMNNKYIVYQFYKQNKIYTADQFHLKPSDSNENQIKFISYYSTIMYIRILYMLQLITEFSEF